MEQTPTPVNDQEPVTQKRKTPWVSFLGLIAIVAIFFAIVHGVQLQLHTIARSPVHQATQATPVPVPATGTWSMFMHDIAHSNYNPDEKQITPATVSTLKTRFIRRAGGIGGAPISTQAIVVDGVIYWGSWDGYEHATSVAKPDTDIWSVYLGKTPYNGDCSPEQLGLASTASYNIVNINNKSTKLLYLGGGDGTFYALNALTGEKIWTHPFGNPMAGYFLWSSPSIYQGSIYMGIASWGDCPLIRGSFVKMDPTNGTIQAAWYGEPTGCVGAGVWSSPTIDRDAGTVYFSTGTWGSCGTYGPGLLAQAMVELRLNNLTLLGSWQPPLSEQVDDGDFGATPTLFQATIGGVVHHMVGAQNKNGIFYAFDRDKISAGSVWKLRLSTAGTNIATSAWDGNHLYLAGNDATIQGKSCDATVQEVDPANGNIFWRDCLAGGRINGSVTVIPGLAVVGVGSTIYAIGTTASTKAGQVLFQFQDTSFHWFYVGPTIVDGVLYAPNSDGNFYMLTLHRA